jgi:hypothetical protein
MFRHVSASFSLRVCTNLIVDVFSSGVFLLASSVLLTEDRRNDTWGAWVTGEMSPYDRHLRARLQRKDRGWPHEFDRCLEQVRPALAELRAKGGDADFALFVLTNYRWRHVVPAGPRKERDALIAQIDQLLGNQSVWARSLRRQVTWKATEEDLRRVKGSLLGSRPHDTSAFESTQTDWTTAGPRWASDHSYTCLWALDWHLKQVRKVRRGVPRLWWIPRHRGF